MKVLSNFNTNAEKFNGYKRRERAKALELKQKVQILSTATYLQDTKGMTQVGTNGAYGK